MFISPVSLIKIKLAHHQILLEAFKGLCKYEHMLVELAKIYNLKCVCVYIYIYSVYVYIYDEVRHNELNAHGIFVEKLNVKRSQTLIST